MQFTESSTVGLRSAVITLARRATPMRFVLFPMIHIAERSFYDDVALRAGRCALIVAEGAPAGFTPVQDRMSRIRMDNLVDQNDGLVLDDLGRPILWEYTARPPASQRERIVSVAEDSVAAVALRLIGRYGNPRRLPSLDEADDHDDRWVEGRTDRFLRDRIIDRRDARLTGTLTRLHEEHCEKPFAVAVVYGAAHMPAVVEHLRQEFGYHVAEAEWLTVINAPS